MNRKAGGWTDDDRWREEGEGGGFPQVVATVGVMFVSCSSRRTLDADAGNGEVGAKGVRGRGAGGLRADAGFDVLHGRGLHLVGCRSWQPSLKGVAGRKRRSCLLNLTTDAERVSPTTENAGGLAGYPPPGLQIHVDLACDEVAGSSQEGSGRQASGLTPPKSCQAVPPLVSIPQQPRTPKHTSLIYLCKCKYSLTFESSLRGLPRRPTRPCSRHWMVARCQKANEQKLRISNAHAVYSTPENSIPLPKPCPSPRDPREERLGVAADEVLARLVEEENPNAVGGGEEKEVGGNVGGEEDLLNRGDVGEEAVVGCVSGQRRRPGVRRDEHSEGERDGHGGDEVVVVGSLSERRLREDAGNIKG